VHVTNQVKMALCVWVQCLGSCVVMLPSTWCWAELSIAVTDK
jgi:hypothetical protein